MSNMPDSPRPTIPDRPLLSGQQTWLRPLEERDLPAYAAGVNDREVGGWAGYRAPLSSSQARTWLEAIQAETREHRGFFFAVCELGDDRFMGTIWLKNMDVYGGTAELAIFMDRDHLGGGWGTDAQHVLLAFGFGTLNLRRIWLTVDANNARAIRSYEKVGFQREGIMRSAWMAAGVPTDGLLMAILREEWRPPQTA